jgi:hypothetical protein
MVKISVDEAAAFDMLAILENKLLISARAKIIDSYILLKKEIADQVGADKHRSIIDSHEYYDLYSINRKIFELVDLSKENKVTAKEVDEANYERYKAKQALQQKFFPANGITETKIGYEAISRNNN